MPVTVSFTDLSPEEAQALLAVLSRTPVVTATPVQHAPPPVPQGAPAPPPVAAAPPPPPPPQTAPPADPLVSQVTKAMEAYVKVHKVTGARKVLAQVAANKIQEVTDPAQLKWLLQAFSDLSYIPA